MPKNLSLLSSMFMTISEERINTIRTPKDTFFCAVLIPISTPSTLLLSSILNESYLLIQWEIAT